MGRDKISAGRQLSRGILLRGPFKDWWIRRKARQVEETFIQRFLETERKPKTSQKESLPSVSRSPLRNITFIADCMWENYGLVPELAKIADVRVLDLRPILRKNDARPDDREVVTAAMREFVASASSEPDVVLLYARPSLLSEPLFEVVRKKWKCPLLGMNLDDKNEFFDHGTYTSGNDNYKHWARFFDLNLSSSLATLECYRKLEPAARYFPLGFHSKIESIAPPTSAVFKHKLSFLGSWKPERAAIVEELKRCGIEITLFGAGWKGSSWVGVPEIIFRESQINLGVGFFSPHAVLTNLKGRDFECPGSGACYMTSYNWELANLYEIGKEILCYRSVGELIEMYVYYSKRPDLCLRIAQAAHRRCLAEHTWEKRFRGVFREIGFSC